MSDLDWVRCPAKLGPHYCWDDPPACAQELGDEWGPSAPAEQLTALTTARSDSANFRALIPLADRWRALAAAGTGRLFA